MIERDPQRLLDDPTLTEGQREALRAGRAPAAYDAAAGLARFRSTLGGGGSGPGSAGGGGAASSGAEGSGAPLGTGAAGASVKVTLTWTAVAWKTGWLLGALVLVAGAWATLGPDDPAPAAATTATQGPTGAGPADVERSHRAPSSPAAATPGGVTVETLETSPRGTSSVGEGAAGSTAGAARRRDGRARSKRAPARRVRVRAQSPGRDRGTGPADSVRNSGSAAEAEPRVQGDAPAATAEGARQSDVQPAPQPSPAEESRSQGRPAEPSSPPSASPPASTAASGPPPARPSPSPEQVDELRAVARARALLRSNPRGALSLLHQLEQRQPGGQLMEERRALQALALAVDGNRAQAERAAEAFVHDYPRSPYVDRVRRVLDQ